jgi:acetyltransferase-like isoleucine patch superfamily enzyme
LSAKFDQNQTKQKPMRSTIDISYQQEDNMLSRIKRTLNTNKNLKKWVHRILVPKGQAEPRWFVRSLVNPFFHDVASSSRIKRSSRLDVFPFNHFKVGKGTTIEDYTVINNGVGAVQIGSASRLGIGSVVMGPVSIGDSTITGQNCLITGLDHNYEKHDLPIKDQGVSVNPTHIGNGSFIGANVSILPGVFIGDNAIIGAGSVVTRDVPNNHMAVGNPARLIKKYDKVTKQWIRL